MAALRLDSPGSRGRAKRVEWVFLGCVVSANHNEMKVVQDGRRGASVRWLSRRGIDRPSSTTEGAGRGLSVEWQCHNTHYRHCRHCRHCTSSSAACRQRLALASALAPTTERGQRPTAPGALFALLSPADLLCAGLVSAAQAGAAANYLLLSCFASA